jgi:hypothetical protein
MRRIASARSTKPNFAMPLFGLRENPMNMIAKTLLAGAAISALAAAPASAAPNIHLAGFHITPLKMKSATAHYKTNINDPKYAHKTYINVTSTISFAGTITRTGFLKKPVILWGEAWFTRTGTTSQSKCLSIPGQKAKFAKSQVAKIKAATETSSASIAGYCALASGQTFYGPQYTLKSKTATHDVFTGGIVKKHFSGYNLNLIANTTLNID